MIPSLSTKHGVQGTVLDPIIFLIYVNDLFNLERNKELISYTDDTVVLIEGINSTGIYNSATLCLKYIKDWLDNNMLELNLNKSNYIYFHISNTTIDLNYPLIVYNFYCSLNDNCLYTGIQNIKVIKYLGIIVDEKSKWSNHVQ